MIGVVPRPDISVRIYVPRGRYVDAFSSSEIMDDFLDMKASYDTRVAPQSHSAT